MHVGVGERRRMERAWLAWRLDTAHTSLERSQAAYREAQRASEAAAAQQAAADEALAQAQAGAGQGAGGEEEEAGGHVDSERSVGGASERR